MTIGELQLEIGYYVSALPDHAPYDIVELVDKYSSLLNTREQERVDELIEEMNLAQDILSQKVGLLGREYLKNPSSVLEMRF